MTDGLPGAREKKSVFWALSAKKVAQIAARSQHLKKSSRFQNEKRGDRVVLKVKIESFSKCGIEQYQRDNRVVLKVAPQDAYRFLFFLRHQKFPHNLERPRRKINKSSQWHLRQAAVRDGALAGLLSEYRRRSNGQSPARHPIASNVRFSLVVSTGRRNTLS